MRLNKITLVLYAGGLLLGLVLVAVFGAVQASSTPKFCGSCHIMAPYYESWVGSSHGEVACVDCHIPPGVTAEIEKKYEAVAMVARYFTGTYGTRPWTEIEDSACLRCHERRLLAGSEVFGDIVFDHRPHLTELRRGKRLKCTSCHSQIVQGSHMTVTASACILCHFKGQVPGEGTARCRSCHQVPETVHTIAGDHEFDHSQVKTFGMPCEACHAPASPTEGVVPRERCLTCHSDPRRLQEAENGELLHQTHVTDHKVECLHCHLEIDHVAEPHTESSTAACDTCHGAGHSAQRDLYAGIGGVGIDPMPDAMHQVGLRCSGCHLGGFGAGRGDDASRRAGVAACMSCHGPSYGKIYDLWQETLDSRTEAVRRQLESTAGRLGSEPPAVFADARTNFELVDRGHGIHNFSYSLALLAKAHEQINEARSDRGLGAAPLPWPEAPFESACLECHQGVETHVASAFGGEFPHRQHVVEAALECSTCHSSHEERAASGAPA
ncbi:MAG: NapC/NirT family cytochrome c, partial [Deltaproteobacteria bacterium]|nr:NapC/NirT family cytochrome c [Deltaproteobacteria bacterium]